MALPGHRLIFKERGKQIELLLEQRFVLGQIKSEQRKRLGERAAPQNHFGAPVGSGVERREALKHPDRIVRRQHRHRRAEMNALGARGDRRQHDLGRRYGKIRPVVLAKADEVDAHFVGEYGFVDNVANDLRVRVRLAVGPRRDVAECVQSELDLSGHELEPQKHLRPGTDFFRIMLYHYYIQNCDAHVG